METENSLQIIPIAPQNQAIGFPKDLTKKVKEYGRLGLEGGGSIPKEPTKRI